MSNYGEKPILPLYHGKKVLGRGTLPHLSGSFWKVGRIGKKEAPQDTKSPVSGEARSFIGGATVSWREMVRERFACCASVEVISFC